MREHEYELEYGHVQGTTAVGELLRYPEWGDIEDGAISCRREEGTKPGRRR
jgi:hypothetical protein